MGAADYEITEEWGSLTKERNMSSSLDDVVDHKGFLADMSKTDGWAPTALTMGIKIFERLLIMGIAVNLVAYLVGKMHLSSAPFANIVTDFMGSYFLMCLFGRFLADYFLCRYKTVAISSLVQTLGTNMLTISTSLPQLRPLPSDSTTTKECKQASGFQMGIQYLSLYLIAIGIGGLNLSVLGFGTDQFD